MYVLYQEDKGNMIHYYYYDIYQDDEQDNCEYVWDQDYENVEKCKIHKGYIWKEYDEDGVPY